MATAGACAGGVNVNEAVTEASVGDVDYYEGKLSSTINIVKRNGPSLNCSGLKYPK